MEIMARLYGIAGLLTDAGSDHNAAFVFESFVNEPDTNRQWLWARMCLPMLIRGTLGGDSLSLASHLIRREVVAIFADKFRGAISAENIPAAKIRSLFPMACEAVSKAGLSPERLAALLDFAEAEEPKMWLNKDLFGEFLPDAAIGGHHGAGTAMRILCEAPEKFPYTLVKAVAGRLSMLAPEYPKAIWDQIELAAKTGQQEGAAALVRTMELLQPPIAMVTDDLHVAINNFRRSLVASRSIPAQRIGLALWWHLLRLGLCASPSLAEIRQQLNEKKDLTARAEIVNLLAQAALISRFKAEDVADVLLPLARLTDQKLGKAALTALVQLIIQLPADTPEFVLEALDVALAVPTDSGRPPLFGRVIEFLLPRNFTLAIEILTRILRAPAIAGLGKQAQKDIANRLRSPVRRLVRAATQEQRNQLLAIVPTIDDLLQRVIVEAVCHEAFNPSAEALDVLLAQAATPANGLADSTVELIRRHKYARERAAGGETWLELYDLLQPNIFIRRIELMNTEQLNTELLTLLKRVAAGEQFFKPVEDNEPELRAFQPVAKGLLELRRLGFVEFKDNAVRTETQTGNRYINIVGPCKTTYSGDQALTPVIHSRPQSKPRLGIVIALREEFAEFFPEIEKNAKPNRDSVTGRTFYLAERVLPNSRRSQLVATFAGEMTPTPTALVAQQMMSLHSPQSLVMLGIAGGIDDDVRVGDIIIPNVVEAYLDNSKAVKAAARQGFEFKLSGEPFRTSVGWTRLLDNLPFAHKALFKRWQEDCAVDLCELLPETKMREGLIAKGLVRPMPNYSIGHLASGPTVGATEEFSKWLKGHDRKYLGLEMEAAGMMAAANEPLQPSDTLILRAVSDFGDERKKQMEDESKGALRRYAIRNAIRQQFPV